MSEQANLLLRQDNKSRGQQKTSRCHTLVSQALPRFIQCTHKTRKKCSLGNNLLKSECTVVGSCWRAVITAATQQIWQVGSKLGLEFVIIFIKWLSRDYKCCIKEKMISHIVKDCQVISSTTHAQGRSKIQDEVSCAQMKNLRITMQVGQGIVEQAAVLYK